MGVGEKAKDIIKPHESPCNGPQSDTKGKLSFHGYARDEVMKGTF